MASLRIKKYILALEGESFINLRSIFGKEQEERNVNYYNNGGVIINKFEEKDRDMLIQFAYDREIKPVYGNDYREINEKVAELSTVLLVRRPDRIEAFMEYNHAGVKIKAMERTLNKVFGPDITFSFAQDLSDMARIPFLESSEIISMEINSKKINCDFDEPSFENIVKGINSTLNFFEAEECNFTINSRWFSGDSTGNSKKALLKTLVDLHQETNNLKKLRVNCKYARGGKEQTKMINIIDETADDIILNVEITSHGSEMIIDNLSDVAHAKGGAYA
jgi:hypothetical protein